MITTIVNGLGYASTASKGPVAYAMLVIVSMCGVLHGKEPEPTEPFAELREETKDNIRWSLGKVSLARMFNAERDRLGSEFDRALIEFVEKNSSRHYSAACFLQTPTYLQGRKPRPYLSLALLEQGLILVKHDREHDRETVPYHYYLAVGYARLGFSALAQHHKREILNLPPAARDGAFPASSSEENEIYEGIHVGILGEEAGKGCCPCCRSQKTLSFPKNTSGRSKPGRS